MIRRRSGTSQPGTSSQPTVSWFGRDRRANAALNQLARRLYHVCRNAADPFEVAAYLEGLGYNRYRVNREFGLRTTFELAEHLFALTPRRPPLATPHHSVTSPFWWQLATLAALTLSLLLYHFFFVTPNGELPNEALVAWLLTWTLGGTYFMKALETADLKTKQRSFTLLLGVGLLGVGLAVGFIRPNFLEAAIGLLWWQLPATFWLNAFAPHQGLRHFVASILAVYAFFIPPVATFLVLFLAALLLFIPFLSRPKRSTLTYLAKRLPAFLLPALLGLGQSFLVLRLLPTTQHPFVGLALILVTVLATSWLETAFKRSVALALWEAKSSEEFQSRVFRSLVFFLRLLMLAFFLALLVLFGLLLPDYRITLWSFTLLAVALAFSISLLGFGDIFLPATAFMIASLLVLMGFSLIGVVIALTALLGLGVVLYITKVERYGVDLL
jgi:hypothetical protein